MSEQSKYRIKRKLFVEGKDDKKIITAFGDAGERNGRWPGWRSEVIIEIAEKYDRVINETANLDVWGLVDRDWRSDAEIAELQRDYPRLLILPRIMIENYLIDPNEVGINAE